MSKPSVSIVIPAYNEERRIRQSLTDLKHFFRSTPDVEIILVIEKSSDESARIARETVGSDRNFMIIENTVQKGKGFAVRTGMLKAQGEIVFFMDLDLSTPLAEVFAFLAHFKIHAQTDIIIGSRQHALSQILKRQSFFRQKMGQTFNLFVQLFAVRGIKDTQCGFKAFRQKCVRPIFERQTLNGFSFDVEVLLLAEKLKYKIDVLPVRWVNSPHSKVRIVRDSFLMLMDLIRVRWLVRQTLNALPLETKPQ